MVKLIDVKAMNDYMKAHFADGVVADTVSFNVEGFCLRIHGEEPKDYPYKRIKEDIRNFEGGKHVYVFSLTPRKQIVLGSDGISTTKQLIPGHPTYRYSVMFTNGSK